jgi:hypothetical protein
MKTPIATISFLFLLQVAAVAQVDSTLVKRTTSDTTKMLLNMDAVYNRPFLGIGKMPVALGGYVEANWQHLGTEGITEGHQFQMRRLTLFIASTIYRRIKFLSEIEFEDGTKEINIEFASVDVEFHPMVNLRGGVVMNPIGAFNQNHDGPKWEFIDRPISATQLLPATWSNVGFGLYGKQYRNNWVYAYEAYLTNGFDDQIIGNVENKTFLPASKLNRDRFEESFNGQPMITIKSALRNKDLGELGLSYMGGVYNKFREDGLPLDEKRRVDAWAIDFNARVSKTKTYFTTEWTWIHVNVPESYTQQFGSKQTGGFIDIVQPVITRRMLGFDRSVINAVCRLEYVDWNLGKFNETGANIRDDFKSIVAGLSWRPTNQTVIRWNYRYNWTTDILGNPPSKTAGFQFGFSSYF